MEKRNRWYFSALGGVPPATTPPRAVYLKRGENGLDKPVHLKAFTDPIRPF
jgi:hypothetical protein